MNSDFETKELSFRLREFIVTLAHRLCNENEKIVIFLGENGKHSNIFKVPKPTDFSPNERETKGLDKMSKHFYQEIKNAVLQEGGQQREAESDFICADWHLDQFHWDEETHQLAWQGFHFHYSIKKIDPSLQRKDLEWSLKLLIDCSFNKGS